MDGSTVRVANVRRLRACGACAREDTERDSSRRRVQMTPPVHTTTRKSNPRSIPQKTNSSALDLSQYSNTPPTSIATPNKFSTDCTTHRSNLKNHQTHLKNTYFWEHFSSLFPKFIYQIQIVSVHQQYIFFNFDFSLVSARSFTISDWTLTVM